MSGAETEDELPKAEPAAEADAERAPGERSRRLA